MREHLHRRWFWKASHPPALLAAVGLGTALWPGTGGVTRLIGVAAVLPYARFRRRVWPLAGSRARATAAIPLALVADMTEVGTMALASARYRTFLL